MTELVVGAHVVEIRELGMTVGWPALEAECPRLKCTATGIPQIGTARQPKAVNVATDEKLLAGTQHHFGERIGVVHRVKEREARVLAGCRQNGEEGPMRAVVRVFFAARVGVAATKPGPQL